MMQLKYLLYKELQLLESKIKMSPVMRKPAFWIFEKEDTDQLFANHEADQSLYFHYLDSTVPLLF